MKRIFTPTLVFLVTACVVKAAPFTPGNLVVYRVGDGSTVLINRGNPVFLDEYTTNGVLVQSIMLPTNAVGASFPLIASGTATSEGLLTRSTDGRYLVFMGYGTTLGGTVILADTASISIPRVVGRVDYDGNTDTTTALTNFASGNNPRSAASDNGTNLWVGGAGALAAAPGGVAFTTLGSWSATIVSTNPVNNVRQVAIFDDQLYASTAAGTSFRIGKVGTGLPTGGNVLTTTLPGLPTSGGSPYAFVLLNLSGGSGLDTLYVADESTGRGIIKYSLVDGAWVSNGVIVASAVRGLTAAVSVSGQATNVYLYATTGGSGAAGGGSLYGATDTNGWNAPPSVVSATTIATASTNTAFRGVAFAPVGPVAPPIEPPNILSLAISNTDVTLTWTAQAGTTNFVQATSTADGSIAPGAFADVSGAIEIVGSGNVLTNWTEPDGATNWPARYYRIHVR